MQKKTRDPRYCDMVRDEGGLDALRRLAESNDVVGERVSQCASETVRVCDDWQRDGGEDRAVVVDTDWS
jgi:hypothetical protein